MYGWKLSLRYFFGRGISILAASAVALCVFIVVVVMTVMSGLVRDFRQKNHDFTGDCVVAADSLVGFCYGDEFAALLKSQSLVRAVSATVYGVGLLGMPGSQTNFGVEFLGIDPAGHSLATGFGQTLYYNAKDPRRAFEPLYGPELIGCVVGVDLMGGRDADGNYVHSERPPLMRLTLSSFPLTEKGGLARGGLDLVSSREFYFSDVSHSGLVKPDGQMIYIPLEEARRLCGMDGPPARISAIHIRFSQGVKSSEGTERVRGLWQEFAASKKEQGGAETLGDVRVQSWKEYRREMIAPMEKEQAMMSFLFVMLGIITVFIVFVVFYMVVGHKSRDIGIFKSIGMSQLEIGGVFMGYAAIVGVLGSAVGIVGGWVFLWRINELEGWLFEHYHWQLWDRTIYAIGRIPNEVSWPVVAAIGFFAVGSCLFGAFLPSAEAARQDAVRVLQVSQV